jgi:hypothetical protein
MGEKIMHRSLLGTCIAGFILAGVPTHAATVHDATGDFLPSYLGPHDPDVDVTSFSVNFDNITSAFTLSATFAGPIEVDPDILYVIGVNTGTGLIAPFGPLGQPNVKFNQVILLRTDGTGNIGPTALDPSNITISGDMFSAIVPLSLLPSTGFGPGNYGFNLWPRYENVITDFSPENATLAAVPEPASWALLVGGFAAMGAVLRRRRRITLSYA